MSNDYAYGRYANGNLQFQQWLKDGKEHRDGDLPAVIAYYENGTVRCQSWRQNSRHHREDDQPAYVEYYENGITKEQSWYQNNILHRDGNLPAIIEFYANGTIKRQEWYQNGRKHRENGPALIYNDCYLTQYFLFGVYVNERIVLHPDKLTLVDIAIEQDAEARRIMIDRMGVEKYLSLADPKILDVDSHNFNGTRALLMTDYGTWLVCACPSTGRVYHMQVPPETKTCEEADEYLRGKVQGQIIGAS